MWDVKSQKKLLSKFLSIQNYNSATLIMSHVSSSCLKWFQACAAYYTETITKCHMLTQNKLQDKTGEHCKLYSNWTYREAAEWRSQSGASPYVRENVCEWTGKWAAFI